MTKCKIIGELNVPDRNTAFIATKGQCKPVAVTLSRKSIVRIDALVREFNTSRSALIRSMIDMTFDCLAESKEEK